MKDALANINVSTHMKCLKYKKKRNSLEDLVVNAKLFN